MANKITEIWNSIIGTKKPNPLDEYLVKLLANNAIYPDEKEETYLKSYLQNNDVFTVINKIIEPASTVPIFQYDANGEIIENGKMLARLNKPNSYQSRSQLIEAALSYYYIFGNSYIAEETLDTGLNVGMPARLDVLPPQWMQIILGTFFNPVAGYSFYPLAKAGMPDYTPDKIFHWKEFNPDYDFNGGHLKGMSRLRPLLKSIIGSGESYNSLVKAFQAQGMWGLLTMLDEEGKSKTLNKEQKSILKRVFKTDSKRGDLTILNSKVEYTKMGLTIVELEILKAISIFKGNLCDALNVPNQLFAGSQDKTYNNFKEAEAALWRNAIQPSLNALLEGLSNWLAPKFGENGQILKADYSNVTCLQTNIGEMIAWMINSRSFTRDEIREAAGYEMLGTPEMSVVYENAGFMPLSELGLPPSVALTESVMKELQLTDYRKK